MNKMYFKKLLFLLVLISCFIAGCGVTVAPAPKASIPPSNPPIPEGGIISRNTTWSGEVIIDQDILILPNVTLTVNPGSRILFQPTKNSLIEPRFLFTNHELLIQGKLIAEGSFDAPITFSSAGTSPAMKDWAGIILDGSKESVVKNCRIEYARSGIYCINSSPDITNCDFKFNEIAVICQKSSNPKIINNNFTNNETGIACWRNSFPLISKNTITKQEKAGIVWSGNVLPILDRNIIVENKYGVFGDKPLKWETNRIEKNEQDFYTGKQDNY